MLRCLRQQDAVDGGRHELRPCRRRFAALVNRFAGKTETRPPAGRPFTRVRSLLTVEDVLAAKVRASTRAGRADPVDPVPVVAAGGRTGRPTDLAGDGAVALEGSAPTPDWKRDPSMSARATFRPARVKAPFGASF